MSTNKRAARAAEIAVDAALQEVARQVGEMGHVLAEARHIGLSAAQPYTGHVPQTCYAAQRYTHLVVIVREGVPEVHGFRDEEEAMAWSDEAGAQWSETFVTEIVKGPLT